MRRLIGRGAEKVLAEGTDPMDPRSQLGEQDDFEDVAAQDDLARPTHPAIAITRSGRRRNGASTAGRFESGSTSAWRSMPSTEDMNSLRR